MSSAGTWEGSTVRIGPLANIPDLLAELGCDPDRVCERAGVPRPLLRDPDNRVSYLRGDRLLGECVKASKCEHFGLLLGQKANPSHLGVAGFLVRSAETVGEGLRALEENLDLHDQGASCRLSIEPLYSSLHYYLHQPGVRSADQVYDLATVIMTQIIRALCGKDWVATEILLSRQQPHDLAPYLKFFRTTLFFNSDSCAIVFPSHILERPALTADALLHHHIEQEANMLHRLQPHEVVDNLPALLQQGLLRNQFAANDIAQRFGLHERTLHRRLQTAGTTFRRELDHVRESLSIQLLESTSLPICDLATSLGYADSSGFIRAFRRWTGYSPSSWRRRARLH